MPPARWMIAAALCAVASTAPTRPVAADIQDFGFEIVDAQVKQGAGVSISVRLVDRRTGEVVRDAVIFAKRLDMDPDGMAGMTAPLDALPSNDPGVYSFRADLSMAGNWRLSLAAKVQGEEGTLESRLVLRVMP